MRKTLWIEIGAIVAVVAAASLLSPRRAQVDASWPPAGLAAPVAAPGYDAERWARAVTLADADLMRGAARMSLPRDSKTDVDAETGLPGLPRPRSNDEARDHEAYSARVRQYVSRNGLPSNSRKPWLADLLRPREYFEEHRDGAVMLGGDKVLTDGTIRVWLSAERPQSFVRILGVGGEPLCHEMKKYSYCEAMWGPEGSRTVLVRFFVAAGNQDETAYHVVATDAPWCLCEVVVK